MLQLRKKNNFRKTLLFGLCCFVSSFTPFTDFMPVQMSEVQAAVPDHPQLNINWNVNIETVYIIAHLAHFYPAREDAHPLFKEVEKDFSAFAQHPAVLHAAQLMESGLTYDRFAIFPLYFSPLPEGRQLNTFKESLLKIAPQAEFLQWWHEIKDFHREAGVDTWLKRHQAFYQRSNQELHQALPKQDIIAMHESYHRKKFKAYQLYFSPLLLPVGGNYGPSITNSKGESTVYQLLGPSFDETKNQWFFGHSEDILYLMLHEFGHSFCNPVLDSNESTLYRYYYLFLPLQAQMRRQGYSNWASVNYELLNRSVHARLLLKYYGKEAYEKHLQEEENNGFVFIRHFAKRLAEFEKNTQKYPHLESFYPELIQEFKHFTVGITEIPQASLGLWAREDKGHIKIDGMDKIGAGFLSGIQDGDILLSIDGQAIQKTKQLEALMEAWSTYPVGKQLRFKILRENQEKEIMVTKELAKEIAVLEIKQ